MPIAYPQFGQENIIAGGDHHPILIARIYLNLTVQTFREGRSFSGATSTVGDHCPRCEPWCWNIYLQSWVIFRVNVDKYSNTMEHLGLSKRSEKITENFWMFPELMG